ncbi:MAG TPA: hypothetical protein VMJ32_13855 [Pirellulales bacterium]|nr:hypothetical protein [Pirellulales bacterium]
MSKTPPPLTMLAICCSLCFATAAKCADQSTPTADAIIALVGGSLSNAGSKTGPPSQAYPGDPGQVCVDYGTYALLIENQTDVTGCFFWPNWKAEACGVMLTDSRDDMVKKLGNPKVDQISHANNTEIMEYFNGATKTVTQIKFKDGKCTRILVKKPS